MTPRLHIRDTYFVKRVLLFKKNTLPIECANCCKTNFDITICILVFQKTFFKKGFEEYNGK